MECEDSPNQEDISYDSINSSLCSPFFFGETRQELVGVMAGQLIYKL